MLHLSRWFMSLLLLWAWSMALTMAEPPKSSQWSWQNPLPHGGVLWGVWGTSSNNAYAVARSDLYSNYTVDQRGTILHYNGTVWNTVDTGFALPANFYGIWGSGANDIFVVGNCYADADDFTAAGFILHYNGTVWEQMTLPASVTTVRGVWGTGINNVYALNGSKILHYDGVAWSVVQELSGYSLYSIWGNSANDIFAVGEQSVQVGIVVHYDGYHWVTMNVPPCKTLVSIWGSSGQDVFAAGIMGTIMHYNGSDWSAMASGVTNWLYGIWGSAKNNVFAVGNQKILRYNGTTWTAMTYPYGTASNANLMAVWGTDASHVFAVGENMLKIFYNGSGSNWSLQDGYSRDNLHHVWAPSTSLAFAVGDNGRILKYNGTSWTKMTSNTTNHLYGVWGSAANNIFAVGQNGKILRYNGTSWSAMSSPTTNTLYGVWGTAANNLYVVGYKGVIYRYNGTGWTSIFSWTTYTLYSVWGSSADDIFVVGGYGMVVHYNGISWTPMANATYETLKSVHGSSASDVFAVGFHNAIIHYNGSSWTAMANGLNDFILCETKSVGPNQAMVAGQKIVYYDGNYWYYLHSPYNNYSGGIGGSAANDLFLVGYTGHILHYNAAQPHGLRTTSMSGPTTGEVGQTLNYAVTDYGTCNLGHSLEYAFSWGDGTYQGFSTASAASHVYSQTGYHSLWCQMRCAQDHSLIYTPNFGSIPVTILPAHTISTPATPSGLATATVNVSETYTAGYATCSYGHAVEYQFDWGDSTVSGWQSNTAATHAYTTTGTKTIKVQARCTNNTALVSSWSGDKTVTVYSTHTVSQPSLPTGPGSGFVAQLLTYITGATCNQGHSIEYGWDWGDGVNSDWILNTTASYSYSSPATYSIRVRGRCSVKANLVSSWSSTKSVTVASHTVTTPTTPAGTSNADVGDDLVYTTGGSTCDQGHLLEYRCGWGDNSWSDWSSLTSFNHTYAQAGTYQVQTQARCGQYSVIISSLSAANAVTVLSHQITQPERPSGPGRANPGETLTYTTLPLVCEQGHPAEYQFDWGDGVLSGWLAAIASGYSYTNFGVYQIQVQARCSVKHTVLSPDSTRKALRISGAAYDFDGDGKADLTVWEKASGKWQILPSSTNHTTCISKLWGTNGATDWLLVPADYDGDNKCDFAIWKKATGEWYCLKSSDNNNAYLYSRWGNTGSTDWVPVPSDYDGDGKADFAIWHNKTGEWYILKSSDNNQSHLYRSLGSGGIANWLPIPGDYDGDGKQDLAVWKNDTGEWYILKSSDNYNSYLHRRLGDTGLKDWLPVPGDYDGDAKTDIAIWKKTTGEWYCLKSSDNNNSYLYRHWKEPGTVDWIPVPADYDGDAKTDIAIWKKATGEWYCLKSSDNDGSFLYKTWAGGSNSYIPIMQLYQH